MSTPPPATNPNSPPEVANPHLWELATSAAQSFTVVVPRGWYRDLQQRQTGPASFVRWATTSSPDGGTTIITADPDIPPFLSPGAPGPQPPLPGTTTMEAAQAEQWAQTYLSFNLGAKPDFEITEQQPSEAMLNLMRQQRDDGAVKFSWDSAAAVAARYTDGEVTKNVVVLTWTGGGDLGEWQARAIRILSTADARQFVPTALKVASSLELTPGERLRQGFSGENKAWLGAWGKKASDRLSKAVEGIGSNNPPPPPQQYPPTNQPPQP